MPSNLFLSEAVIIPELELSAPLISNELLLLDPELGSIEYVENTILPFSYSIDGSRYTIQPILDSLFFRL